MHGASLLRRVPVRGSMRRLWNIDYFIGGLCFVGDINGVVVFSWTKAIVNSVLGVILFYWKLWGR